MIKVVIIGVCGKMGNALVSLVSEQADMELVGGVESFGHPQVDAPLGKGKVFADLESVVEHCDLGIEFTTPDASMRHAAIMADWGKGYITGTTGFSLKQMEELEKLSRKIPIVYSPNFSIGVNVLFNLTESAAKQLGEKFEVEILEIHHTQKQDAPSGTAKKIIESIEKVKGKKKIVFDRTGITKAKTRDEIGIASIRSGDVVGEHYVIFGQKGERLELVHKASSRLAFAQGVIKAIRFLQNKPAGWFGMEQVLSDKY